MSVELTKEMMAKAAAAIPVVCKPTKTVAVISSKPTTNK
jgi:hypothetical protein